MVGVQTESDEGGMAAYAVGLYTIGDATAYVFGWLRPGTDQAYTKPAPRPPRQYGALLAQIGR
jgi:hypothetical protein